METSTSDTSPLWRRVARLIANGSMTDMAVEKNRPHRKLLWIDAVGGFLICLDEEVVLGQPDSSSSRQTIAIPILADLSRRHALIRRDNGAYILEPVGHVMLDGKVIREATLLADDQLIQLGDQVHLKFRKPHVLSSTARLTIESHHKTRPSVDGVLLMADSCMLGPRSHCHVQCQRWKKDVLLYRQDDQLFCRSDSPMTVDGKPCLGSVKISSNVHVEGEDFSLSVEEIGGRGQ